MRAICMKQNRKFNAPYLTCKQLGKRPVCKKCGLFCRVRKVGYLENGDKVQHRYCPKCRACVLVQHPSQFK